MADILRVTTPLVNRASLPDLKPEQHTGAEFQLSELTRVVKTNNGKEGILQQNNTLVEHESQNILFNMLKDPGAAVKFIHGIFMLQETARLLPLNNSSLTQEMSDMVNQMMLSEGEVAGELKNQEQNSTLFKGALFDLLRNIVKQYNTPLEGGAANRALPLNADNIDFAQFSSLVNESPPEQPQSAQSSQKQGVQDEQVSSKGQQDTAEKPTEQQKSALRSAGQGRINAYSGEVVKLGVAKLLKSINSALRNGNMLDSVANNLEFLSKHFEPSKELSSKLLNLSQEFRKEDAAMNYSELKRDAIAILGELSKSVLFTDDIGKTVSITIYNLSRFNNNPDFLNDALTELMQSLSTHEERENLFNAVQKFVNDVNLGNTEREPSKTMEVLTKLIQFQAGKENDIPQMSSRLETVVHSLLSSPCNYTPLLHFVIPMEYMDEKAFAEMWINPNEDEDDPKRTKNGVANTYTHILMEFEVETIGPLEMEMSVRGENIDLSLFCAPEYVGEFSDFAQNIRKAAESMNYKFESIKVDGMEEQRSLLDVFKTLPYRRIGVDVKA